ncbi:MAG: phage tail tape measure protein, partial [Pseudomonadota bacterium]
MSRSLLAKLRIQMESDLARKSERDGRALRRLGRSGEREFNRLGRAAIRADRALNSAMRRTGQVVGAGIGFAAAASVRRLSQLETRLERLGIAAGKSSAEMEAVRDQINVIANDPNIRIDPGNLFDTLVAFQQRTGEFDFGLRIAEQMAIVSQATGVAGRDVGNLAAVMRQQFRIEDPQEMFEAMGILVEQGKAGAVELPQFAQVAPKVFSALGRTGARGVEGVADAGALLQRFIQGTGSSEEAATIIQTVINELGDPAKLKTLRSLGINTSQPT